MNNYIHKPVLMSEVLAAVRPQPGGRYVDGTVGMGGHAAAILKASEPTGWLFGFDRDGTAIESAGERLAEYAGRFELRRARFDEMSEWVEAQSCDAVLLDLGVSSPQLDEGERGFSFQRDAPLDMRMDQRQGLTAADIVNDADIDDLTRVFRDLGGERRARQFARAIERERKMRRIETTGQLANMLERIAPRRGKRTHPATKAFLGLRLEVNDEMGSLRRALPSAMDVLKPAGRLAIITFHSLEDRIVKQWGREAERDYDFVGDVDVPELRTPRTPMLKRINRKPISAGETELSENPRARSAQLRVFEKQS
ncbi:MAG: 16S rRNA (cytosine1402-N4)-methyltransferase [Candidatus Binatia bacterium]